MMGAISSLDVAISDHLLTARCNGEGFSPGQIYTNTQGILDTEDTLAEKTKSEETQNILTMC